MDALLVAAVLQKTSPNYRKDSRFLGLAGSGQKSRFNFQHSIVLPTASFWIKRSPRLPGPKQGGPHGTHPIQEDPRDLDGHGTHQAQILLHTQTMPDK